jgi:hypothetical protein
MSIMHTTVHTSAPVRREVSNVRDHRAAPQPIRYTPVRDHREPARTHRDDDDRRRVETHVVVAPAPIRWAPAATYEYAPPTYYQQAEPVSLMGATALASDQLVIGTAGELGGATSLQLESVGSGATYVSQLVAYDAAGCAQVIAVNAMLSPQNPFVQVALSNGGNIVRIAIDGHSEWGGAIALQAL